MHHDWRQFWVELVNVKIQPQLLCNVKVKYFLIPHNACCNLMHVAIWWATSSSHVIVNSKTQLLRIQFSIWPTITNRLTYRHPRVTLLSSNPVNGQTHSKVQHEPTNCLSVSQELRNHVNIQEVWKKIKSKILIIFSRKFFAGFILEKSDISRWGNLYLLLNQDYEILINNQ